ncbi:MAG TPA: NAD(P)H nitroreductase [Pseudonocardia sp.]|jgi:nitroreductase|nr:NAD(P)H nitroreductase [Pseudonocardia sp.]
MIADTLQQQTVLAALALANRAPSVHNSQPWRWQLDEHSVHLYADLRRWLPATDPDGRDLLLSCGAALHHLTVALAAADIRPVVHRLPNPDEQDHLAAVELHRGPSAQADLALIGAIERRRTDRRRFAGWPVPEAFLAAMARHAAEHGVLLREVTEPADRRLLKKLITEAALTQTSNPDYPDEIALWSGRHGSADGVPAANAPAAGDDAAALPMRQWAHGELPQQRSRGEDGAVVLILGTSSDDRLSQLRAGEAASAVLLHATDLGLASSVLSQPLEVAETRRMVRDQVVGGTVCPQLLIRVGWPPAATEDVPRTPRRPVAETVERIPR